MGAVLESSPLCFARLLSWPVSLAAVLLLLSVVVVLALVFDGRLIGLKN